MVTSIASYLMTRRLFTTSERGLATLRIKAFRHVHDLPLLTQNTERRGALVSRVTSDVDQVSQFLVFGGLIFIVSVGQMMVATVVMLFYSWQLALVVWLCFAPLFLSLRYFQRKLSDGLRHRTPPGRAAAVGDLRARRRRRRRPRPTPIEDRTQARIDEAIDEYKAASTRAQGFTAFSFSLGGISAGLANAGVIVVGIWLGFADQITSGEVLAFAFLVTLFVGPVQMGTQILTDAQNAIAGWRRVIGILDTPADLVDPGPDGETLPRGPIDVRFEHVDFAYPDGPLVLRDVTLRHRRRHPNGHRGGDRLGQVHLRQAAHPADGPVAPGAVLLDGVDVREIRQASLRRSVVLVPQEGFLFDDTLRGQRSLRPARGHRRRASVACGRRARPGRLARRPPARPGHPGRPARRVAVGGGAAAGRAAARPPRRPRPAGPRRGHQRRRPPARDADRPGPRAADAAAAPRSPSRTGSPPPRTPTRSWSSTAAASSSAARTPHWLAQAAASTPGCTPRGSPSRVRPPERLAR